MLEKISRCSVKLKRELISNGKRNKSKSRRPTTSGEALVHPGHPRSDTLGKNGSQAAKRSSIQAGREARSPRGPTTSDYLRIEKDPKCKIKIRKTTRKQHATKARTNFQETTQRTHRPSQAQSTSHTTTEPVRHKLRQLVPRQQKTKHSTKTAHTNTQQDTAKTKHQQRGGGQNNFLQSNPFKKLGGDRSKTAVLIVKKRTLTYRGRIPTQASRTILKPFNSDACRRSKGGLSIQAAKVDWPQYLFFDVKD